MDKSIKLSFGTEPTSTMISNTFIDKYMANAHGTYVKVYIYLLRCLSEPSMPVSISVIADKLDETEKDICKALKYWEKQGVLKLKTGHEGQICDITIFDLDNTPSEPAVTFHEAVQIPKAVSAQPVPADPVRLTDIAPINYSKPSYTAKQLEQFRDYDEFNTLIDYIEEKLCRTLTHKDLQTPAFLYESLGFPADLIRHLYDYCMSKNKKSSAYIEKVAREWAEQGIDTVEKAIEASMCFSKEYLTVKSAFGISRNLGEAELAYITRWSRNLMMPEELIKEACSRTILSTGKPDFNYADKIITKWHTNGISSMSEVAAADAAHAGRAAARRTAANVHTQNKFTQFPQRSYKQEEYADIERRKLNITN